MDLKSALVLFAAITIGCLHDREAPSPNPTPVPDTNLCGQMCQHLGPQGLKCQEGNPVYDSDKPGSKDVPNESCEEFCKLGQDRGYFLNPRCLITVPSCDKIESFRKKAPETCKQ
jgi:hypothetical protein